MLVSGNMEKTDNVICQATKSALNSKYKIKKQSHT